MKSTKQNRRRSRAALSRSTLLLIVLVVTLALIFGVLAIYFALSRGEGTNESPVPTEEVTEPATEPLEPAVSGNGDQNSVLCKGSYSVQPDDVLAEATAALAGTQKLTNGELQVHYLSAVSAYRNSGAQPAPDFSLPLDCQLCPLALGQSWQHYFLNQALNSWRVQQALIRGAAQPQPITEEAYLPDYYQDLHGPNVAPDLPVHNFLYADKDNYTPNEVHQAYLDNMDSLLEAKASTLGYATLDDYAETLHLSTEALVEAARNYNFAYMYFTEKSFYCAADDEELEKYVAAHKAELSPEDEHTVDVRHILLIPEGAAVAADGTVTATEAQWKACQEDAKELIRKWQWDFPTNMIPDGKNINFSRFAFKNSADAGSNLNGGLYSNVRPGQLIAPLDEWCFAPERQPDDMEIICTDVGCHIVFLASINRCADEEARAAMILEQEEKLLSGLLDMVKLKPDYSTIALWADTTAESISMEEILYPDVAHERYPQAMVYFQQDYPTTSYGSSNVSRGGCGITTMAMLATFMKDELITPAMLAKKYATYHDENGTRAEMFLYVPAELGFQLEGRTFSIEDSIAALKENKRVVSLNVLGHFTRAGHYLLLQQYYEETDTFQVRDSNIANYGRLSGHKVDYFSRAEVTSGATNYFIFPEKVTRIPACTRCGGECSEHQPDGLIQDYQCPKCIKALSRRNNFLTILDEYSKGGN